MPTVCYYTDCRQDANKTNHPNTIHIIGGTENDQQLNASIRAYKAYQERTGEDCTAKIAELERLRNKLIEENRIT